MDTSHIHLTQAVPDLQGTVVSRRVRNLIGINEATHISRDDGVSLTVVGGTALLKVTVDRILSAEEFTALMQDIHVGPLDPAANVVTR